MKYGKPMLTGVLSACALLVGCQSVDSPLSSTLNALGKPLQVTVAQTNETIVSQLITLNKTEIAMGQLAAGRAHHRSVKRYAATMEHEHGMALKQTMHVSHKTGIKPAMNVTSQNIQNEGNQQIASL